MKDVNEIIQSLKEIADEKVAGKSKIYFKTGPGEYAEGDQFLGIRVPTLRKLVKEHPSIELEVILDCLKNEFHEARLFALLLLVQRFNKKNFEEQKEIFQHYLNHTIYINNWDLVDTSAPNIIGAFLYETDRRPLYQLAQSANLWERRIAIVSTYFFIKRDDFQDCLKLSELLLNDHHDLIHKAVGWMLRETGKRDKDLVTEFLKVHYKQMPRTMLRYAIERYPEVERQAFLKGTV